MKITDMKPSQLPGNTKAFFKVETEDGFVIDGFKVMNGKNGLFVSPPSRKAGEKFYDTVTMPREVKTSLTEMALREYGTLPNAQASGAEPPAGEYYPPPEKDLPF